MSEQKIEGVPDGWRLVAMRKVKTGEWFIGTQGSVDLWRGTVDKESVYVYAVIEKIERPKQFRQFANAAEFEPHRDRWVRVMVNGMLTKPISYTDDKLYIGDVWLYWGDAYSNLEFADGTPFGVEVTE